MRNNPARGQNKALNSLTMNPNLKWKVVFIVLVILGCIYGLVGLPTFPTSVAQLKDNFGHQIKLGLDLQGGTHLVLQVQTQEAMAQETDQMVERISTWLRGKNISYDEVRRVDDTHILVRNVDSARLPEFRDYVNAQFANFWDMSPTAGDPSSYTLTLRGAAIAQIQENTMTQSLETDRAPHQCSRFDGAHDSASRRPKQQ